MHDFLNTCILYTILMNMSIPKMNKNAIFIKNFQLSITEKLLYIIISNKKENFRPHGRKFTFIFRAAEIIILPKADNHSA